MTSAPGLKRITPSEVEQNFLLPLESEAGTAATTYSVQGRTLQAEWMRNLYPDLPHHSPALQAASSSHAANRPAWSAEEAAGFLGSGPSGARLVTKPRSG